MVRRVSFWRAVDRALGGAVGGQESGSDRCLDTKRTFSEVICEIAIELVPVDPGYGAIVDGERWGVLAGSVRV